ncbi:Thiamin-phosphate pyrophosphorylase [Minicystis rosea]|nr:Thiamin-phosphate pyrophosphorylase [Minicystis rosea]
MNLLRFLPALVVSSLVSAMALAGCASSTVTVEPHSTGRALGEACAFDDQCDSLRCSGDATVGTCGACVAIQPLGEPCTGPLQGCSRSAICADGVCRSLRKVLGEACALGPKGEDTSDCDDELYCARIDGSSMAGTCTARTPEGSACESYLGTCAQGTSCGVASHRCEVPAPGTCVDGWSCPAGFHCDASETCQPGTLQEGDLCGIVDGSLVDDECAAGLVCGSLAFPDGGGGPGTVTTCLKVPNEGEPCISGACGAGLFCRHLAYDNVTLPRCERGRSEGEACRNDNLYRIACAEGLECRGDTCQIACH